MADNLFQEQFIKHWKSLDFSTWNEADVREDFIAPLLKILGYAKNTVDSITREPSLSLQQKYHRIGRKQIEIDYIPTIRLKKFWIIEAKPGNSRQMNFGDLLQAHFYAIHPEINARFIVMANGWEIRVYDALVAGDWADYLCLCTQDNCEVTFPELVDILGSKTMTTALRKYILATVKDSLLVEVDVQKAEELKSEVFRMYWDTLPVIRQNARDLQMRSWKKAAADEAGWLRAMPLDELFIFMDRPTDARGMYGMQMVSRMAALEGTERHALYRKMIQKGLGRPHNIFKVQCVIALGHILETGLKIENDGVAVDVLKDLEMFVTGNMAYWQWPVGDPADHIGAALCHLDNICARLAYKFSRRFAMEPLKAIVNSKNQTFAAEDLLANVPSVARELIGSVRLIHELLWYRFLGGDSREIWDNIWHLEETEKLLEQIPQVDYSDGDADLLWFDHYGIDFDILRVGTWNELNTIKDILLKLNPSPELTAIINLTRDEVIKNIPGPLARPAGWAVRSKIPLEDIVNLFTHHADKGKTV